LILDLNIQLYQSNVQLHQSNVQLYNYIFTSTYQHILISIYLKLSCTGIGLPRNNTHTLNCNLQGIDYK